MTLSELQSVYTTTPYKTETGRAQRLGRWVIREYINIYIGLHHEASLGVVMDAWIVLPLLRGTSALWRCYYS